MARAGKIVAIVGTYRKGKVIDTLASEVLRGAADGGAETEKIYLVDKHIEFCENCRTCVQEKDVGRRGTCVHDDDMAGILDKVDAADGRSPSCVSRSRPGKPLRSPPPPARP